MSMKRVAIIGIQGIPAGYGGFETLVENLVGEHSSPLASYTVFCSSRGLAAKPKAYRNARLKYIPFPANGIWSVLYDFICLLRTVRRYDTILVLGVSGCLFLPFFRLFGRKNWVVNIDGLEHRRGKWGRFARWFLRVSEASAARWADVVVADNEAIREYVWETYRKEAVLIAYGGDHALRGVTGKAEAEILERYDLVPGQYAVSVCRIEPENNCGMILEAFAGAGQPLLFIGNWNHSGYGKKLREKYASCPHIMLPGPVYDPDALYIIRKHAGRYIHGHSAGGTNPSLVEAMHCGCRVTAFDCTYNRHTTENRAEYFRDAAHLAFLLSGEAADNSSAMAEIARRKYVWADIVRQYENLY